MMTQGNGNQLEETMLVYFESYGTPEILKIAQEALPPPAAGEVRVSIRAISVNPADWMVVAGVFRDYLALCQHPVPGVECAGVVEAVGAGVTRFSVGDRVIRRGSSNAYRQAGNYPASELLPIPSGVDFEQAACLTVAGSTAYTAVRQLGITAADTLLVHAAAGGVGSAVVQIAKYLGARVIGTASTSNHAYLRSIGAEPVSYEGNLVEDIVGLGAVTASFDAACRQQSVAATVAVLPDLRRSLVALDNPSASAAGIKTVSRFNSDATAAVLALASEHQLVFEIGKKFRLSQAREALEYSRHGHLRGKIVLQV